MRILEGIFKDIGQCLNHLVYRSGLMCIFHCLEIQGLQGVEQKMGINLQLKGCHLCQLLFLLLQSQLAAKEGLVQKELNQVVKDYIVFIFDERGLFRVKYTTLRIREHFNEIINLLKILFGNGISNPQGGGNHCCQDHQKLQQQGVKGLIVVGVADAGCDISPAVSRNDSHIVFSTA